MAKVAEPEEIAARRQMLGALMQGVRAKLGKIQAGLRPGDGRDGGDVHRLRRRPA